MSRLGYAAKAGASSAQTDQADLKAPARAAPPIVATGRAHPPLCSFAQEQFWFVDQLTPGNAAHNFSWPIRLRGTLDTAALERGFAELIRRHESLRTRFGAGAENGQVVQIIDAPGAFALNMADVSRETEPEQAAQRLVDEETQRPFDLGEERPFRARLLRLSDTEHILQVVVHHIAFDEWSKVVLYRELGTLYEAHLLDRPSPLPELEVQYADFAQWQRSWLTDDLLQEDLAFWASELARMPTALDLPSDRPRPPVASLRGARRRLPLPAELTSALEELAEREQTDFFAGLLALFDTLLHRYTDEDDLAVGVPVDHRIRPEIDDTIGVFLNTVVMRSDLSGRPSFRELLQRVRERMLAAAAHSDLPFELLVREVQPARDLSRHPLFQVLLAINPAEPSLHLPGIEAEEIETEVTAAGVDLFLFLQERPGGFDALWEYSTDLFEEATIDQLHTHLIRLLEAVVEDPDRPIDTLAMLSEDERQQLLVDWNNTERDYPPTTLHELVEAQVERSPEAIAVVSEQERLTYAELNSRANQLARRLRAADIGPDSLVAVSLERSPGLIVSLLGILKAGGAYIPLDPDLPSERLAFMLADSGAEVLVTEERLLARLPPYEGTIVCLDTDQVNIVSESPANLGVPVEPENLAYVIYTSGSTGQPKGVLNTHRGIVNRLLSMQETYSLDASDRLLLKTPSSFDVSVREVFWPLLFGARLVVAAPGEHGDPSYLVEVIEREQVTTLHFVPSMLQLFLDQADPTRCRSLRCVLSGGEALSVGLARRFFESFECELHNLYGPTEAAVSVTTWPCDATAEGSIVPIGRPVSNTQIHVLDAQLDLVPVGVWGELVIGGAQVARGYHDRPALTAERFIPNPFGPGHAYRTGDVGRWNRQGALEFGGRIDDQVKVRGFRVELGEIEAALRGHEMIVDSAVVLIESADGQSELAAYVVLDSAGPLATESVPDFYAFLRAKLPDYMVPTTITTIEELPLSPSGKLDRSALPSPDRRSAQDEYVAPETPTESAIAEAWSELLQVESVGRSDNFFALGGHSLLAARFLGRMCKQFDIELPLRAFLQNPTVAGLATEIDAAEQKREPSLPPLVARTGVRDCSFAQESFWLVDQIMGETGAYNIPVPLRLRGPLRISVLERALSEIVRRHEILRTRFSIQDDRPVQVVEPARPVSLSVIDLSTQPDESREQAAQQVVDDLTQAQFDATRGPLIGIHLLRLGDGDHILHLVFNHLVFDGVSKPMLLRELGALYNEFTHDRSSPLPEPGIQYGDFAEWQRSWLKDQLLELELGYWKRELEGMPAALELPTDRKRPAISTMGGAWDRSTVPPDTVEGLRDLARREGATLFMALLAAFDILLYRYSGQDDVVVGMPVDGRDRPELDDAIGVFVNTLVLRVDLSGSVTFRELLDRVSRRMLDAVAHQRLPFGQLVRELHPDRDLGRHPLYQVMLTFVPTEPLPELADLEVEEIATERRSAPIDLTVFLEEHGSELGAIWEYSTDLFERATIERMQAHFLRLLDAVIAEPDRPIDELPMLAEAERRQLLDSGDQTADEYQVACLHELFEAQVVATPDADAVTCEGETISYRELNQRANRVAHRLRELGVGTETPVALCLQRSFDLVVGIIAVLKAGGAYVPLDSAYPPERLEFVLSDTRAPVVLTQEELLPRLPVDGAEIICLDRGAEVFGSLSEANLEPLAKPESLAYVIYTSGSTGQPKGVQVEHRQVARLFSATDEWFGFGGTDTWLLFHSYAFDFSVWELWGALLYGGRLVIAPLWTTRSPEALATLLVEERVTVLNATPSLFVSALDDLVRAGEDLALRLVVFGGEALQPSTLRPWFQRFGADGPELVNMYGITETTVHVTYRPLSAADCEHDVSPIGRPIPDLQLFVLDAHLNPVPKGVPGELYVGGAGVARGYLNRPELTAERFVPNPFGAGRLYRSGDGVRFRDEHELEYLGRLDDQVKIRGFRVELGEIQAALTDHDATAESAVVAFDTPAEGTRLAGYVVPSAETAGAVRAIARMETGGTLASDQLVELPGGMAVAAVDRAEAEFLHERIIAQRSYLQHGIAIPDDACVLDVGANIGLFSILVDHLAPGTRIFAIEPNPELGQTLALNAEIYGLDAVVLDCALGRASGSASLTYVPRRRTPQPGSAGEPLKPESVVRPLRTISDVLGEHGVERLDLLKISVTEDELDVLAGVDAADWHRILQVAVEVRSGDSTLSAITHMLEQHGLAVTVAEDKQQPGLRFVFAQHSAVAPATVPPRRVWRSPERLRSDLRTALEEKLPGFMVPSSLMFLDELPLTSNGKLDRKALPTPAWGDQSGAMFVPPRTPTEERIAEIWKEILGIERVGADDNFFHLGGHSLLAARVATQVRDRFDTELSVRALFEYPTLAALSDHVTTLRAPGEEESRTDEEQAGDSGREPTYPLAVSQKQLLLIDNLTPGLATYNGATAIRIAGDLDRDALEAALADVVERHEALRTVFTWEDEGPAQVVQNQWQLTLPMIDLASVPAETQEAELRRLLREEARRPFDLSHDLMLRATLFKLGAADHALLVVAHHIASDGWSVGVFCRDLGELYSARRSMREASLPELPLQYHDFCLWQRERLRGERLESEVAYWRSQLAGAPSILQLPTDRPRPRRQTFEGASHELLLPREVAQDVLRLCREEEATPYMLLLSAFGVLLYRLTGQDDILVSGPFANRGRVEFDQLIGFFANTLVLRVRLAGNPPFTTLLSDVRRTALEALDHQEFPFERVVEAVRPERDPAVNPLVQVNFRVRVDPPAKPELGGATTSTIPVDIGFAGFDLALDIQMLDDGIVGEFIYNTELFDHSSIERLAGDYDGLLRQILENPEVRLLSLELPSEQQTAAESSSIDGNAIRGFREASRSEVSPS